MALSPIESFVKTLGLSANQFMVAGASKRGWWVTRRAASTLPRPLLPPRPPPPLSSHVDLPRAIRGNMCPCSTVPLPPPPLSLNLYLCHLSVPSSALTAR